MAVIAEILAFWPQGLCNCFPADCAIILRNDLFPRGGAGLHCRPAPSALDCSIARGRQQSWAIAVPLAQKGIPITPQSEIGFDVTVSDLRICVSR